MTQWFLRSRAQLVYAVLFLTELLYKHISSKRPHMTHMQIMEDRGGELRKAKERYRLVILAARPAFIAWVRV